MDNNLELPHFILDEILRLVTRDDQIEFLALNRAWYQIIYSILLQNLELTHALPSEFYQQVLPKEGHRVHTLKLGFYQLPELLKFCPNVKEVLVAEEYQDSLDDDIESILSHYPKLVKVDLNDLYMHVESSNPLCSLNHLTEVTLPDMFDELDDLYTFLSSMGSSHLTHLSLKLPILDVEIFKLIATKFTQLQNLSLYAHSLGDELSVILDLKFPNLNFFELVVPPFNSSSNVVDLNPHNYPKLRDLCVPFSFSFAQFPDATWSTIKGLGLSVLPSNLNRRIQDYFPNLSCLALNCELMAPSAVNLVLQYATTLKTIELHNVTHPEAFDHLPSVPYHAQYFSLYSSSPVHHDFFRWLTHNFPHLHHLTLEFNPQSTVACSYFPLSDPPTPFPSLVFLHLGGHCPISWIRGLVHLAPRLDLLALDKDLYLSHSSRLRYTLHPLTIIASTLFTRANDIESEDETSSFDEDDGSMVSFSEHEGHSSDSEMGE